MPLPRIQYAVPRTLQVCLEIAKAIHLLAANDEAERLQKRKQAEEQASVCEVVEEIVAVVRQELRKATFDPNEPRVPAGNSEGGEWTSADSSASSSDQRVVSDASADDDWTPGAQYAANEPPGIGHNQGPPLEEPPEILPDEPATAQLRNAFLKAAARWLLSAGVEATLGGPAGDFLAALQAASWLCQYLPYIYAYLQPPKTWAELQQDALSPQRGYDIHHPVEQSSALQDGFPPDLVDGPENRLRIPTLSHWQITAWYQTQSEEFGGLSPREYLRGKSWDERLRIGKMALIRFGVLQP